VTCQLIHNEIGKTFLACAVSDIQRAGVGYQHGGSIRPGVNGYSSTKRPFIDLIKDANFFLKYLECFSTCDSEVENYDFRDIERLIEELIQKLPTPISEPVSHVQSRALG
jgi:hypothetical protein